LTNADTGDFVVKDPRGNVKYVKERWLLTYHRVLTLNEIRELVKKKEPAKTKEAKKKEAEDSVYEKLRLYDSKIYNLHSEASNLCDIQPESCLNTIRKILEALCESIAIEVLREKELRTFRKGLFSDRLEYLKSKGIFKKRKLLASIDFLKKWGDLASHYQNGEEFSGEDARLALKNLENVISWYVMDFRNY
jgi:hypothetical protein